MMGSIQTHPPPPATDLLKTDPPTWTFSLHPTGGRGRAQPVPVQEGVVEMVGFVFRHEQNKQ